MDTIKLRHCAGCGSHFAPSEAGDFFCSMHCTLADMGEPCGDGCARCHSERAARAVAALHALAIFGHAEAVLAHQDAQEAL